ncbi:MAG: PocR ligand-binding domain-containing protein [Phycisphaerae bacterium]
MLLEAILEQWPVPTVVASVPDQMILYANRAAVEALCVADEPSYIGITLSEAMARQTWRDLRPDGTPIPLTDLPLARAARGELTRNEEYIIVRKDGTRRWQLVSGTPIHDHDGVLIAGLVVFPDITDRKLAEDDRARLTAIAEGTSDLVATATPAGRITYMNAAGRRLLGWSEADDESCTIDDNHPAWAAEQIRNVAIPTAIAQGVWQGETVVRTRAGREVPVSQVILSHRDAGGEVQYLSTIMRDMAERKQAEDEIKAAAREWQTTFDAVSDVVWLLDPQFRVVRCNAATLRQFNRPVDEVVGRHCWEIVHGTRRPIPECPVLRMKQSKRRESTELKIGERWYSVNVDPILDEAGNLIGAVHIVSDMTDRKQTEQALQSRIVAMTRPLDDASSIAFSDLFDLEEIQKLQDAFTESSGVAQLITDPEGNPITRPSGFCRLCAEFVRQSEKGRQRCAISDASLGHLCIEGPTVRPCLSAGLWGAGASIMVGGKHIANWLIGQVRNESLDLNQINQYAAEIDADPEEFRKALLEVPVMSEEQFRKVARTLFILANELSAKAYQNVQQARFIAERKQAEQTLRENAERLRLAMQAASMGTWEWDLVAERVTWSPETLDIFGVSAEAFGGTYEAYRAFAVPEARAEVDEMVRRFLSTAREGAVIQYEHEIVRGDGRSGWIEVRGTMFVDSQQKPVRMTGICTDITARKVAEQERAKLEAQLRQSQKLEAVGQLAGGVAHDFNNILTAVFGNVELAISELRTNHPGADGVLDGLQQIERSAERASALTRQLLAFSRRQVTRPELLDLNRTLRDLEKMLRRLITENITLTLHLTTDRATVRADPGQLEQVIVNLVVNARDAMPEGGKLAIETQNVVLDASYAATHPEARPGAHVLLAVSDTGCGMERATQEKVFEPFFTTKPVGQGTGLGLPTVYGIVKQAGGHVALYSELGQGTTFRIYLPLLDQVAALRTHQKADTPPPSGTETILICEDDLAVRELAACMLREAGYSVLAAPDAGKALKLAADHPAEIDLLVTDVIMPDMNGRRLSDALRQVRPGLRTLFMSGYPSNVIAHHGVLEDDVEFLEKPFSRRLLLQRVREVLDRAKSRGVRA